MGKIFLFVVLALVAYAFIKAAARQRRAPPPGTAGAEKAPERMVSCMRCGVNLPQSEAVQGDGAFYCCDEHRQQGAR